MKEIEIRTAAPYRVIVGPGLLSQAAEYLGALDPRPASVLIVTDDHVAERYLNSLAEALSGYARIGSCVIPSGEEHKTPETLIRLVREMSRSGLTRSDLVIALGGGVVGDTAGFAAAVYQRGIRFVQCPTTLLSAVDASVGGKTAVDLPEGKNLIGAFHQPSMVLCDTDTFRSLPELRVADGAAEMIKHGVIADSALFETMRSGQWKTAVTDAVIRNVEIKQSFVVGDERDTGRRQLLNFGHTLGHAVEALSGFTLSHGQSVAVGMVMETRAARRLGMTDFDETVIEDALRSNGLPVTAPYTAEEIRQFALRDKKRSSGGVQVAVPVRLGMAELRRLEMDPFLRYIEAGVRL